MQRYAVALLAMLCGGLTACAQQHTIKMESPAVEAGGRFPTQYTGDGKDVSLPLKWSGAPAATKTFALICDDPDAPSAKPWVHWVLYDIPASVSALPEGVPTESELTTPAELKGAKQGPNGWNAPGYRGPKPPPGKNHHYAFTLYALDADLDLKPGLTREQLLDAMKSHILATGKFIAVYSK